MFSETYASRKCFEVTFSQNILVWYVSHAPHFIFWEHVCLLFAFLCLLVQLCHPKLMGKHRIKFGQPYMYILILYFTVYDGINIQLYIIKHLCLILLNTMQTSCIYPSMYNKLKMTPLRPPPRGGGHQAYKHYVRAIS